MQVDIALDLSARELTAIPILETFLNIPEQSPTIIDLRSNLIKVLPIALFLIPTLKQLKLDHNMISSLPKCPLGGIRFKL